MRLKSELLLIYIYLIIYLLYYFVCLLVLPKINISILHFSSHNSMQINCNRGALIQICISWQVGYLVGGW